MLQFQEVSSPQPLIWSPIALPTRPMKRPTIGPNAKPKNGTSAKAGADGDVRGARQQEAELRQDAVQGGADRRVDDRCAR